MADIPASNITQRDPGLPVAGTLQNRPMVFGIASSGTVANPQFFTSPSKLVSAFGYGQGVEDALQILALGGGPVGFCRVTGSVSAANSAVTTSGSGPTVTVAGSAVFDFNCIIEIMGGGILGAGKFRYTLDNYSGSIAEQRTYSGTLTIPAGGIYLLPGTGITVTFAAGTYVLADTYAFTADSAGYSSSDATTALSAALNLTNPWRYAVFSGTRKCGNATAWAGIIAAVQTSLDSQATNEVYRQFMAPTSSDISVTAAAAASAIGATPANRALIMHGLERVVTQYSITGRSFYDVSAVRAAAVQAARLPVSSDLKRSDSPIPGTVKLFYDESIDAGGLDDVGISTMRTWKGNKPQGFYITQGRIKSAAGSDITVWPRRTLLDMASEIAYEITVGFIGRGLRVNANGTIFETDAKSLEKEVNDALQARLVNTKNQDGTGGHVTSAFYVVDTTTNFAGTGTVEGDVSIKPLQYVDYITTRVGFSLANQATV